MNGLPHHVYILRNATIALQNQGFPLSSLPAPSPGRNHLDPASSASPSLMENTPTMKQQQIQLFLFSLTYLFTSSLKVF
jgi:hypothetical protein